MAMQKYIGGLSGPGRVNSRSMQRSSITRSWMTAGVPSIEIFGGWRRERRTWTAATILGIEARTEECRASRLYFRCRHGVVKMQSALGRCCSEKEFAAPRTGPKNRRDDDVR